MAGLIQRFLAWRREVSGAGRMPLEPEVVSGEEQQAMAAQEQTGRGGWLTRLRGGGRQQQMATLQQGFTELVDMTRSIRDHLDTSVQTQRALLESLRHLPDAVESLKGVGKATEQQTETLSVLRKQLESAARSEEHMVESMRGFSQTLKLMDDLSKHTSNTVSSMADRTRESEEMLQTILERSERRLVAIIAVLTVLTLTVLGVGVYVGLGSRGDSAAAPLMTEEALVVNEEALLLPQKSIADLDDQEDVEESESDDLPSDENADEDIESETP
jgi:hypothetical protein